MIDAVSVGDSKNSQISNMKGGLGVWDLCFELPCHPLWPHLCLMELLSDKPLPSLCAYI